MPFAVGAFWMPESPTYLLSKSHEKEACQVMDRLYRQISEVDFRAETEEKLPSTLKVYKLMFTKPEYLKPMLTGIVLMAFFQVFNYHFFNNM